MKPSIYLIIIPLIVLVLSVPVGSVSPARTSIESPTQSLIRWCVVGLDREADCWRLSKELKRDGVLNLACVRAAHKFQCIRYIQDNVADATNADAESTFAAGVHYGLKILLYEKVKHSVTGGRYLDDAVMIVRKYQDYGRGLWNLKGKKLCISGTAQNDLRLQGLVNVMLPLGYMKVYQSNCDTPIASIAAHFGNSCVPGTWSLDTKNRERYKSLCLGCKSVCTEQDYYAGAEGAIRCLLSGNGDVALTSSSVIAESNLDPEVFERLCIQGTRRPLNDTCSWIGVRPNALLVSPKLSKERKAEWKKALMKVNMKYSWARQESALWLGDTLFSRRDITIEDPYYFDTYDNYLGNVFIRSMGTPFPKLDCGEPTPVRWCVVLQRHLVKCREMAMAFQTKRIKPDLRCVRARTTQECTNWLVHGQADITILQPEKAIAAHRQHQLVPIAAERRAEGLNATSYMVTAVKKEDDFDLGTLLGARSCHRGVDDILSWQAPLLLLEKRRHLQIYGCDFRQAASGYFWRSCVPDIGRQTAQERQLPMSFRGSSSEEQERRPPTSSTDETTPNPDQSQEMNPFAADPRTPLLQEESLCSLCPEQCRQRNLYGPERNPVVECLRKRKGGNVGFLTDDALNRLDPRRFELLCMNGQRAPLEDFARCQWLKIPPKVVVVSGKRMSEHDRKKMADFLKQAAYYFGPELDDRDDRFSIFRTDDDPQTLFDEKTETLQPVYPQKNDKNDFKLLTEAMGEDFVSIYQKTLACSKAVKWNVNGFGTIVPLLAIVSALLFRY